MLGPVGRQLTLYWSINFIPYNYNVSVILSILCKCIYVMKLKINLLLLYYYYYDKVWLNVVLYVMHIIIA